MLSLDHWGNAMGMSKLFREIAEDAPDIVCLHEPDGRYMYVSPSASRILGYDPAELVGTDPYALVHPDDVARIQTVSHPNVLQGQDAAVTYRIRNRREITCGLNPQIDRS